MSPKGVLGEFIGTARNGKLSWDLHPHLLASKCHWRSRCPLAFLDAQYQRHVALGVAAPRRQAARSTYQHGMRLDFTRPGKAMDSTARLGDEHRNAVRAFTR